MSISIIIIIVIIIIIIIIMIMIMIMIININVLHLPLTPYFPLAIFHFFFFLANGSQDVLTVPDVSSPPVGLKDITVVIMKGKVQVK